MPKKYFKFLFALLAIYIAFRTAHFLKGSAGSGDEGLFIRDLEYLKANGIVAAVTKQVGIVYLLWVYPFSLIFKNYIALRVAKMTLFLFTISISTVGSRR